MKIVVFGGTGWLGHNIVKILAAQKYDVTVVTRGLSQRFSEEIPGTRRIVADKRDEEAMRQIFQERYTHVIDTVPQEQSIQLIARYAEHLQHYIHCSSTGGYTPLPFLPCNETAFYRGFAPGTGWAHKSIVDNMVLELNRSQGFPATILRPCYITGPGALPLDNLGGRRPDFIADILAGRPLDLPNDGRALLQPIHVIELARSFHLAMLRPQISIGQVYNICLDHAVTLNRYLELTASAFHLKPSIHYMSVEAMLEKYGDTINETGLRFLAEHMCFTIDKARRDLDFQPQYTPEEAILETALWAAQQN